MNFDHTHEEAMNGWPEVRDLEPIGCGVTRSFVGWLPSGDCRVMLKRRDRTWSYDENWFAQSRASHHEWMWYALSQLIGEHWRKVPTCIPVNSHLFELEQFADDYLLPSTGVDKDFEFIGTLHYWLEDVTHDPHDATSGTPQEDWPDYVRMKLLDCILHHRDRHEMNWLIDMHDTDSTGQPHCYWIDNGRSMTPDYYPDSGERMINQSFYPHPSRWTRRGKSVMYRSAAQLLDKWGEITSFLLDNGASEILTDLGEEALDNIIKQVSRGGKPEEPDSDMCQCPLCKNFDRRKHGEADS